MEKDKNVLLLGASMKPFRYSNMAVKALINKDFVVCPVGKEKGEINGVGVKTTLPPLEKFHTVSIYLNKKNQRDYYEKLFMYSPERVIFNPGAENDELKSLCKEHNVDVVENCTLEMVNMEQF